MLKRLVLLLAAVLPFSYPSSVFSADQAVYAKAAVSVVRVAAAITGRGSSLASGVALPGGRVVTNCHVTQGAQSLTVIDANNRLAVEGQGADFAADLCVLATGVLSAPPAQVGSSHSLKVGDQVVAVGFGGGLAKSLSPGEVTALFPYRGGYVIRTSAAFRPGASGGGLFDRDGRLVGILTFFRRGIDGYSFFAIPAEWIDKLPGAATADTGTVPFWMRKHEDQPHFLQVATFESDQDWRNMVSAARAWVAEEPTAVPALEALARARSHSDEPTESAVAIHSPSDAMSAVEPSDAKQASRPARATIH